MADSSLYQQYHHNLLPTHPAPISQHQSQRKAVFARLTHPFIGTSRPPSSSGNGPSHGGITDSGVGGPTSAPNHHMYPRNLKYNLESPVLALSATTEGDKVVVAGREILRILRIGNNEITELSNLRVPGEQKKHFQYDVKWGPSFQKNTIATAGTNGTICLYDANVGKLDRSLKEHGRQVHRLAFNMGYGNLLLSASQDGTIKLWDLREQKSRHTFIGKSDAARDVQFNSNNATQFAAAFDNGCIQRWDYRKPSMYERKINAHNGPAFAVDWHPDGKHCASGGRDRSVKVWDFDADARRKPKHTITTMASVSRISWRPLSNAKTETTQLATCAINNDHRIQLWDIKRPYVPSRIMDVHDNATTGILWKDGDILWSCSKDCTVVQNDVPFASQPINSITHSAFAWSPESEFTFLAQRRGRNRNHASGLSSSRATFDADEDYSMREERRIARSGSFKTSKPSMNVNVLDGNFEKFEPSQAAARVSIPSLFDKEAFDFFAKRYIIDLEGVAGGRKWTISEACERNARLAYKAQKFRTAKSWKMIQLSINSEDAAAEKAKQAKSPTSIVSMHQQAGLVARRALGFGGDQSTTASGGATPRPGVRSPLSNSTTPTARKPENIHEQLLSIQPTAFGRSRSNSVVSVHEDAAGAVNTGASDGEGTDENNDAHKLRPSLTVDTATAAPKSRDFAVQSVEETAPDAKMHAHRASIDENHNLPLFTATTERSDPMSTSLASNKPTSNVDIAACPLNSVTTQSSPSLARQFSLVSEQTSSSYGILPSGRSLSDIESPRVPELPPVIEDAPIRARAPSLTIPPESEKPWSTHNLALQLINYATEQGDPQTAATLLLLLHRRLSFSATLVEEVIDSYITLLTRLRLFSAAAMVRKLAPCETIRQGGQFGVDVDLSCGICGRAVGGRGGGTCAKCAGGAGGCVICGGGRGKRWTVCGECGHGGCEGCLRGWFLGEGESACAGVGCDCACLRL